MKIVTFAYMCAPARPKSTQIAPRRLTIYQQMLEFGASLFTGARIAEDGPAAAYGRPATLFAHGAKSWTPRNSESALEKILLDSISALPREHCWLGARKRCFRAESTTCGSGGCHLKSEHATGQKDFPLFKTLECGEKNISLMSKHPFYFFHFAWVFLCL